MWVGRYHFAIARNGEMRGFLGCSVAGRIGVLARADKSNFGALV